MSNLGLKLALKEMGIDTVQTNVGDRYVLEEMLRGDYSLGGEQSGHVSTASLRPRVMARSPRSHCATRW